MTARAGLTDAECNALADVTYKEEPRTHAVLYESEEWWERALIRAGYAAGLAAAALPTYAPLLRAYADYIQTHCSDHTLSVETLRSAMIDIVAKLRVDSELHDAAGLAAAPRVGVPREPTQAMVNAGCDAETNPAHTYEMMITGIWRAMYAAAPAASKPDEARDALRELVAINAEHGTRYTEGWDKRVNDAWAAARAALAQGEE
jgi:hypothetical protein